jgi:hypothetical protein
MFSLSLLLACAEPAPPPPAAAPAPVAQASAPPPDAAPEPRDTPRRPPKVTRIRIQPTAPRYTDAIEVTADAVDRSGEAVDLSYAWRINGSPVPDVSGPRLPPGRFKKGDKIYVEVTATTPGGSSTDQSPPVTIANTLPVLKTDARSVTTLPGTTFFADDPDGDTIRWSLENAPRGMTISPDGTVRYQGSEDEPGGPYKVAVVASDGDGYARFEVPIQVSPGSAARKDAPAPKDRR